ncbi:hypothetical protein JRQ81_000499, partial [Phrynocephalus forsythii]
MPLIHQALKGWDRKFPKRPDRQKPITPDILRVLLSTLVDVCWSSYKARLFTVSFHWTSSGPFRWVNWWQTPGRRVAATLSHWGADTTPKGTGYCPQVIKIGSESQRDTHYLEKASQISTVPIKVYKG